MPPVPSTSESIVMTSTPSAKRRHHRVRNSKDEFLEFLNSTEIESSTSRPPFLRKTQLDERARTGPYGTSIFARGNQAQNQNSLAGVFILIFVLIGIILVMILFYFLAKVCNSPPEHEKKRKLKTKKGTMVMRDGTNDMDVEVVTTTVPLPKRIYELKAEEGYYSCPPSIENNLNDIFGDGDEDFFNAPVPPRPQSAEGKNPPKASQIISERKLTGFGLPPGFKPKGRLQEVISGGI